LEAEAQKLPEKAKGNFYSVAFSVATEKILSYFQVITATTTTTFSLDNFIISFYKNYILLHNKFLHFRTTNQKSIK
jgi:hypothetical protein